MQRQRARISFREKSEHIEPSFGENLLRNAEIVAFILSVLFILFLLYPGERIWQALSEERESNLDLSIKYIENLIAFYPHREDIKFILAKKLIAVGEEDRAISIMKDLKKSGSKDAMVRACEIEYHIEKSRFLRAESKEEKTQMLARMKELLNAALNAYLEVSVLKEFYREALSAGLPDIGLIYAQRLAQDDGSNRENWLKEAYKQALATSNHQKAIDLLEKIAESDTENRIHWLNELAKVYAFRAFYIKASETYLKAMSLSKGHSLRKQHFILAIKALLSGNEFSMIAPVIRAHESEFIRDVDAAKLMIKALLASNNPSFAGEISAKIMGHAS